MEIIDVGSVIDESIAEFSSNPAGDKPRVWVMIPSGLRTVPWRDRKLEELVRIFLYEIFLTSDSDAIFEISLRRWTELEDLDCLVEANPSYWLQLRIAGRGLKMFEKPAQALCYDVGYRCEKWLTVQDTSVRLAAFEAFDPPDVKIILCLESSKAVPTCDLLFPVLGSPVASRMVGG